jgi:hypothetical protein
LFRIEFQFRDGTAKRVAVHAQLARRFALVSPVMRQHFENEAPFELTHCFVVMNAAGVHLRHKTIQLTFHENLFLFLPARLPGLCLGSVEMNFRTRFQPVRLTHPERLQALTDFFP